MDKIEIALTGAKKEDIVVVVEGKKYTLGNEIAKPEVKADKSEKTLSKEQRAKTIKKVVEYIKKDNVDNKEILKTLESKLGKKLAKEIYQSAEATLVTTEVEDNFDDVFNGLI